MLGIRSLKEMEVIPGRSTALIFSRPGSMVYWEWTGSAGFKVFCSHGFSLPHFFFEDLFDQPDIFVKMIPCRSSYVSLASHRHPIR